MEKTNNSRLAYVDLFRGIGILLMIMGHVDFGRFFGKFIHAFHMPMFFFVTGYFFNVGKCKLSEMREFLKKKIKSLLVPYAVFGIAHYAVWLIMNWNDKSLIPLGCLLFENTADDMPIAGALWFLTALFLAETIYFLLVLYLKKRYALIGGVCAIVLLGHFAPMLIPFRLPFGLDAAFVGVGFIHAGACARKYEKKTNSSFMIKKVWLLGLIAAISVVFIFVSEDVNMRTGEYGNIIFFWINALGCILVGWTLSRWIMGYRGGNILLRGIINYICDMGKNSIIYVCLNQVVILLWRKMMPVGMPTLVRCVLMLLFTLSVLHILTKLFSKSPFCICVGKSPK